MRFYIPLLLFLFLCACAINFDHSGSQVAYKIAENTNLNAYKYIRIYPIVYEDKTRDAYYLESMAANVFRSEGMTVMSDNNWSDLNQQDIYKLLTVFIDHTAIDNVVTVEAVLFDMRGVKVYESSVSRRYREGSGQLLRSLLNDSLQGFAKHYTGHSDALALVPEVEIRRKYRNWEEIDYNEAQFKRYLDFRPVSNIEGIWSSIESNEYKLGIIKNNRSRRNYVGFILQTENPFWLPKFVKMELFETAYENIFKVNYYMADHSLQHTNMILELNGVFELTLKDPDGNEMLASFIKMYPPVAPEVEQSKDRVTNSEGSGFLVSQSGLVATNWHVISDYSKIIVTIPSLNRSFDAFLEKKDEVNDLAIIKMRGFDFWRVYDIDLPYRLSTARYIKQGQKVITIGYPLGDILGRNSKVSDGIINSISGLNGDTRILQISNPIQPGNSGGPLFDVYGNISGVVVASINAKFLFEQADVLPQNVNFAVKSDCLINLLSRLDKNIPIMNSTLNKALSVEKQAELFSPFIVKIEVEY